MKLTLRLPTLTFAVLLFADANSNAATTFTFTENFDASTTLPTGWTKVNNVSVIDNVDYARSGNNALWIANTSNANTVTTPKLALAGGTEATISFWWTTDVHASAFGRRPQIQYSSDGTTFTTIGFFTVPATTSVIPDYTQFTKTITAIGGYSFTSNSVFRIVGDDDAGGPGAPLIIDDFSVTAMVPEPSTALAGLLLGLGLLRRRR